MRRYRLSGPARADLRNVWKAVAHRSEGRADRFLDELAARFQEIADRPLSPGSKDIMYDSDCRIHTVCEFVIFYRPRNDCIEIVRVLESAGELNFW